MPPELAADCLVARAEWQVSEGEPAGSAEELVLAVCPARLKPQFQADANLYLDGRRVNCGSATILVHFTVDERGETAEATVATESSSADRPDNFDRFAEVAPTSIRAASFKLRNFSFSPSRG